MTDTNFQSDSREVLEAFTDLILKAAAATKPQSRLIAAGISTYELPEILERAVPLIQGYEKAMGELAEHDHAKSDAGTTDGTAAS